MNEKKQSIRDAWASYQKDPNLGSDGLLKCLEEYRQTWSAERQKYHDKRWKENAAFYSGDHYVRDPSTGQSTYRVRLKENHTNNAMNRMLSIFAQNIPVARVFPSTTDARDLESAEGCESWLKYYHRKKKLELRYIKHLKYATIFGNSFAFIHYDPDASGEMVLTPSETESGDHEIMRWRGDAKVEIDDPYRYAVRPGIDEIDDMWDILRSVPTSRDFIESKYGPIEAEGATAYDAYNGTLRKDDERVMIHHYYHKPTPWFEEGLYVSWCGKKILAARKALKCESRLPVVHLPFDKPVMKFWGMSTIEQVMDLQEQINRAASMIIEARNLIARPRVLVSDEAKMPGQSFTDRPGEITRYKIQGGKPDFYVPSFNFAEMQGHKADVREAFNSVAGMTNASRGEIPAATRTALALQLVLEQDRSQWAPFVKHFNSAVIDINERILGVCAEFFDEQDPRTIKIEGASGSVTFHGGMVPSPLDMYLEDTNALGWTAAGRQEGIMTLIDKGVLQDRREILEMLKLNSSDPALELMNIHRQKQARENEQMRKGVPRNVGPADDHSVHMIELDKVMASFSFDSLPQAVKDVFNAHRAQHMEAMQAMAPMGPEGPGGPAPSGGPDDPAASMAPPMPGANMDELLTATRGGMSA